MIQTAKTFLSSAALLALGIASTLTVNAVLPNNVTLRNYFGSMTFARPVQIMTYPGEDSAFVVVQQAGKLMTVRRVNNAWAKTDSAVIPVLNGTSGGNEQGLLGVTFHPNFRQNRKYYVYYIATGGTYGFDQIAERIADSTLRPHSNDSQRTVLRLRDPYDNHNSGTIRFGADGYLYFALGDGGSGGDPQGRAQNLDSLFGKFMRLDVSGADAYPGDTTRNYAVPGDNPFFGQANARAEIWAYGVRNPYRWTFHPTTGEIWVGDVGQDAVEEISHVTKGANMGWKTREGNSCYSPSSGCSSAGMTPAVIAINQPVAQSITGGDFFTGNPSSLYHGVYFFGDYVTDSLWAARIVNDTATERIRIGSVSDPVSFDRDRQGRVLVVSHGGTINVLESPDMQVATSLRPARLPGVKAISAADLLRRPEDYSIQTLDGRRIQPQGRFNGTALVRKKGSAEPPQLLPLVW
jgi:glucose/arabinose dehydrogenase